MTSNQESIYMLFNDFKELYTKFIESESIKITPHYVTYEHPLFRDNSLNDKEKKELFQDCLGEGKYCLSIDHSNNVSPLSILEENIIQKCIYLSTLESPSNYVDYMIDFYHTCFFKSSFTRECSEGIMSNLGIELKVVNNCYEASFLFPGKQTTNNKS